jgi:hypothetical protein
LLEVGNYDGLKKIIDRDYKTFSGRMLEKYFRMKIILTQDITHIGSYWDRKGENEIDLIVVNEFDREAQFIEVKRNAENISLEQLKIKAAHFLQTTGQFNDYRNTCAGLSLKDM